MDTPSDTNVKVCLQLLKLSRHLKTTIEKFAVAHDLTVQQMFVLYNLYTEDNILMGTLAKHLHCDASNVTWMVDRLESFGLIERHELPEDRRAKQLVITTKGRTLIDSLIPLLPAGLDFASCTNNEVTNLSRLLNKLIA